MSQPAGNDFDVATAQAFSPQALVQTIGSAPHVVKIFTSQNGRAVRVWTVVDSFRREVRDRIYSAERNLFTFFPGYKFDFHVIEGDQTTILSDAKLVYSI